MSYRDVLAERDRKVIILRLYNFLLILPVWKAVKNKQRMTIKCNFSIYVKAIVLNIIAAKAKKSGNI